MQLKKLNYVIRSVFFPIEVFKIGIRLSKERNISLSKFIQNLILKESKKNESEN